MISYAFCPWNAHTSNIYYLFDLSIIYSSVQKSLNIFLLFIFKHADYSKQKEICKLFGVNNEENVPAKKMVQATRGILSQKHNTT